MSSLSHPLDHPERGPHWALLRTLIEAVSALIAPAGSGREPVFIDLRKRIRLGLRRIEGELRRLMLPEAEALLAGLPPLRQRRPSPGPPRRLPQDAPDASPARRRGDPLFRFRLHESTGERDRSPAFSPHSSPPLHDPYGLETVSAEAEFLRFCRIVVAFQDPGPDIHRLALILRRRSAGKRPRTPWRPDWQPRRDLDLSPPFCAPAWLRDPPPASLAPGLP